MAQMAKAGTTRKVTTRAKKTGRIFVYEVYTSANGKIFTARVVEVQGYDGPENYTHVTWSDPCDSEKEAMKLAFHDWSKPFIEAEAKRMDYYRSGGY